MKGELKGQVLLHGQVRAHSIKMDEISALLDSATGAETGRIGLFFGPTLFGYQRFVDAIGLDLRRGLLAGHEITWTRSFMPDEPIHAELRLVEHTQKNGSEIGTVETRFTTPAGEIVQTQRTTFIERPARQ